jgi:hypothetical protein
VTWLFALLGCGTPLPSTDGPAHKPVVSMAAQLPDGPVGSRTGQGMLQVRRAGAIQNVFGTYEAQDGVLRFEPRRALSPGRYEACNDAGCTDWVVGQPANDTNPPSIEAVWPDRGVLPANALKLTVRFSAPIRVVRDIGAALHLVDLDSGAELRDAFALEQLWSPDRTALTVLFHPGRIKRDIGFARDMPPLLVPGHSYALLLDPAFRDKQGRHLRGPPHGVAGQPDDRSLATRFVVGPIDEVRPDPSAWRLELPRSSDGVLVVHFDEPMDAPTTRIALRLARGGQEVPSTVVLGPGQLHAELTPGAGWEVGQHSLVGIGRLEDLAGNRVDRRFDSQAGTPHGAADTMGFEIDAL